MSAIRFWRGYLIAALATVAGTSLAAAPSVTDIPGTTTGITSNVKTIISFRNQVHSWQTADGAVHLMVNQGTQGADIGLALYSSYDGGSTWIREFTVPDTIDATEDGELTSSTSSGATLQFVYNTVKGGASIRLGSATYAVATQSWSLGNIQTAYSQSGMVPSIPAFTIDDQGNYWCAFTVANRKQQTDEEILIYLAAGSSQWQQTGVLFGTPDDSTEHSARPLPFVGGVAALYQDDTTLYWAYRLDGAPITAPWTTVVLATDLPPESADPYGTHYSVVADADDNLYLAYVTSAADLIYTSYTSSAATWQPSQQLAGSSTISVYPEVTLSGGSVMLFVNDGSDVSAYQSTDGGETFTLTQTLTHPPIVSGSGISYGQPRVESPRYATSPVPVWEQFIDSPPGYGLLFFQVPVLE
jgi:hypothetical protein